MKKKFFLLSLIVFQVLMPQLPAFGADEPLLREQRLARALTDIVGIPVQIRADNAIFEGSRDQVESAIAKLNNFEHLRQNIISISGNTGLTQNYQKTSFSCWGDCLESLGVPSTNLRNFAINNQKDDGFTLEFPYVPNASDDFNNKLVDLYFNELKAKSPLFNWINQIDKEFVQQKDDYRIINYGRLAEYLCKLQVNIDSSNAENDRVELKLPLQRILKRLIAVAGHDLSLVKTGTPGKYKLRTIMLGDANNQGALPLTPTIEIIIDKSASMGGAGGGIDQINRQMPNLLKELRGSLREGQSLNVSIFAFNDTIDPVKSFTLSFSDDSPILWENISASGLTNLAVIGDRLSLNNPEEKKVVVAFTDGEHTTENITLPDCFKTLKELQHKGMFAQPYLCAVGQSATGSKKFFSGISQIFAGAVEEHKDISAYCKWVSSQIPSLLESNTPIVLTLNGENITIRQKDGQPDIHVTTQILQNGDTVVHKGKKSVVNVGQIPVSTQSTSPADKQEKLTETEVEAKIAELKAQIADLELKKGTSTNTKQ